MMNLVYLNVIFFIVILRLFLKDIKLKYHIINFFNKYTTYYIILLECDNLLIYMSVINRYLKNKKIFSFLFLQF